MKEIKREKYGLIWKFIFGDDIIIYKRLINCTDLDSAIDYAEMFVEKFGYKYGICVHCDIVINSVDIATVYFSTINGVNIKSFVREI